MAKKVKRNLQKEIMEAIIKSLQWRIHEAELSEARRERRRRKKTPRRVRRGTGARS